MRQASFTKTAGLLLAAAMLISGMSAVTAPRSA